MKRAKWLIPLLCLIASTQALEPISEVNFSLGYRVDKVQTNIRMEEPVGFYLGQDTFRGSALQIAQVGMNAYLKLPNLCCDRICFENWWWEQFYVRGAVYWGHGSHGRFKEDAIDEFDEIVADASGRVQKIRTFDYNYAIGWLFPFAECFATGPAFGYAYNKVRFKTHEANLANLDHMKYSSVFRTYFFALDAVYKWDNCMYSRFGYEYHLMHKFRGSFRLRGVDSGVLAFSDTRHSDNGFGNVVYAELRSPFSEYYFEGGIRLQYSYFKAASGPCHFHNTQNFDIPFAKMSYSTWRSFSVTLDIGYEF